MVLVKKAIGLRNQCIFFSRCQSQDRCRRPNFLESARHPCKLISGAGERTPPLAGYSPSNTDASPSGVHSSLVHAGSANPLSVSLLSWAARRELRAPSGAAEGSGSHGWRVGRGSVARLGAHRSRGWRRLQRAEGLPRKLAVLGTDFGLGARSAPGGPARPPGVIRGLAGGRELGAAGAGRVAAGGVPGHRLEAAQRHRTARSPQRW